MGCYLLKLLLFFSYEFNHFNLLRNLLLKYLNIEYLNYDIILPNKKL